MAAAARTTEARSRPALGGIGDVRFKLVGGDGNGVIHCVQWILANGSVSNGEA
jgi:hypothetical protein